MTELLYPVLIEPLSEADGGGFLARVPDLPGCMSDGETPEAAIGAVRDAIAMWIAMAGELGHGVPPPAKAIARAG